MLPRAAVPTCLALALLAGSAAHVLAQEDVTPPPPQAVLPTPPPAKPGAAPRLPGPPPARARQPVNVRLDAKISDLRGGQTAATKAVSLTVSDGQKGYARSSVESVYGKTDNFRAAFLKIDARPEILEGQKVLVNMSLDYNLIDGADVPKPPVTTIQEGMTFILESGKPLVVAESAEPGSDRRVRLEVTATILR